VGRGGGLRSENVFLKSDKLRNKKEKEMEAGRRRKKAAGKIQGNASLLLKQRNVND